MLDLTPLSLLLSGLGPWGILVGAVLTLVAQRLKKRFPAPAPAPDPANPNPAPVEPALPFAPTGRPVIDAILKALLLRLSQRQAFGAVSPMGDNPDAEMEAKLIKLLQEAR